MIDLNELKNGTAVRKKSFDFTVLTPLFMHGWQETRVKPNGKIESRPINAELRGPSIRGLLRYWWRSLQADGQTNTSLLQKEQILFGGSSGDETGKRSPLLLKLSSGDQFPILERRYVGNLCPHKSPIRSLAIAPGRKMKLEIQVLKKDENLYQDYIHYCRVMFLLAGFGQRSRRGGGSVQLEEFNWNTIKDFRQALQQNLDSLQLEQGFNYQPKKNACLIDRDVNDYTYPRLIRVWIGQPFDSPADARKRISEAGHKANTGQSTQMLGNVGSKRLASPLLCTIRAIGNRYYPLVSEMSSPHMQDSRYVEQRNEFLRHLGVEI